METPSLVLASTSKTRQKMLSNAGLEFSASPAAIDEKVLKDSLLAEKASARDIADFLAEAKARSVSFFKPDALVIGADQTLVCGDIVFSKATDKTTAASTLRALSCKTHRLYSAAVIYEGQQAVWRHVSHADLTMRPLSDDFIEAYLDTLGDDAFWSVGSYQLEGLGAQLFSKIDGDYFTILGLPLLPLLDYLRRRGCIDT